MTLGSSNYFSFKTSFYDGIEARRKEVVVYSDQNKLIITSEDQAIIEWFYTDIDIIDKPEYGKPAQLGNIHHLGARLLIEDQKIFNLIKQNIPTKRRIKNNSILIAKILGLLLICGSFIFIAVPLITHFAAKRMPIEYEKALSRDIYENIISESEICDNPKGVKALNKLVHFLTNSLHSERHYQVAVLDLDMDNAVSLPGGYIILFNGFITQITSEEEILGVLAHEIGHIEMRHGVTALIEATLTEPALNIITSENEVLNNLFFNVGSRKHELEADQFAIQLLDKTAINPNGLITFLERSEESKFLGNYTDKFTNYISTHPASADRIKRLKKRQQDQKINHSYKTILSTKEWKNLKKICMASRTSTD